MSSTKPPVNDQAMRTMTDFAFDRDFTTLYPEGGSPCPYCGVHLNTAHSSSENAPVPGRLTVCMKCSGICQFGEELKLQPFTDADVEALPPEHRAVIQDLQALVREANRHRDARARSAKKP